MLAIMIIMAMIMMMMTDRAHILYQIGTSTPLSSCRGGKDTAKITQLKMKKTWKGLVLTGEWGILI